MFDQTIRILDLLKFNIYPYFIKKPTRVTYEITRRCNLQCQNCYVYNCNPAYTQMNRSDILKEVEKNEVSYEEYKIRFAHERAQGRKSIFLIGGEPTLRMDVIELAYEFFGRNLSLVTNGIIKIPARLKFPFAVSVDGGKKIHNQIRGNSTWGHVFSNYADDHRVLLSSCLRKGTTNQIQTIIDEWLDTDVFGVSFFFATPPKGNTSICITDKELVYAKKELHKVVDEYPNFVRMTHDLVELLCQEKKEGCPVLGVSSWYDYQGNIVHHCLLGENADCSLCGCVSPLYIKMISKWWKYLNKRTIDILTLPRDMKQCRMKGQK
jgi:MoaA/NifB/PqqE/SkfB family radical SAM enzyme